MKTQTTNKSVPIHDTKLIEDHESKFDRLAQQGEDRGTRLSKVEKKVEEGFILLFDALGIREKSNGERKIQIQEALAKISEVKEESETDSKSLRDMLVEMQIEQAEIKGYIKGQDKREATETKQHDDDIKQEEIEMADKKWHLDRMDKWLIAILTIIVATCGIIAGLSL
jgi:hypothetical protein